MAKLIMRLTCSFGLLALVGLTGAATAAAPAHDQPVTPRSAAAAPIAERMPPAGRTGATDCGKAAGSCATRTPHLLDSLPPAAMGVTPYCAISDQCSPNSPFSERISAGLISRECATVTECSGPSRVSSQNFRKRLSTGNFGQRS